MAARLPRGWGQYFHPQASRPGTPFTYRPGWHGTGMQPIRPTGIGAYTGKATGVPLTGGQSQGIIPGFGGTSGNATSPAALTVLGSIITFPVSGSYTVSWTVTLAGTLSATDTNNFILAVNGSPVATSINPDTAGTYPQAPATVNVSAGDQMVLVTGTSDGTTGSVYSGTIAQTAAPFTLTAGPQGLATTWYPAQVTLSTTTGALDTSTALVYLGSQGVPITLVGSVFTGNGTVALAIPSMTPGQVLIVTWTNGHPGDTAAFNIVGTMDALRTG